MRDWYKSCFLFPVCRNHSGCFSRVQEPFVDEGKKSRSVVLPGGTRWYDTSTNRWINGGRKITVKATLRGTPLYVRDRSILPLARLQAADHAFDAARADFHVFLSGNGKAEARYVFDDGISFAYRKGKRSEVAVTATRKGRRMDIRVETLRDGFGPGDFTFTTETSIGDVRVNGVPANNVRAQGVNFCAKPLRTWMVSMRGPGTAALVCLPLCLLIPFEAARKGGTPWQGRAVNRGRASEQ